MLLYALNLPEHHEVTDSQPSAGLGRVLGLMFMSRGDRNLGVAFQTHPGVRPRLEVNLSTSLDRIKAGSSRSVPVP